MLKLIRMMPVLYHKCTVHSTVQYGEFENGEFHKGWSRPALPRWLGAMKRGTRTARCLRGKSAAQCCSVCEACMSFNLGLGLLSAHLHSYQQDRVCAIRSAGAAGGRECFLFDPDSNPDQTDMA